MKMINNLLGTMRLSSVFFFLNNKQWLNLWPWELTWLQLSLAAQRGQYHSSQTWPPYPPEERCQGQRQHDKKARCKLHRKSPSNEVKAHKRHTFIPAGLCCRCWAGPSESSWTLHTGIHTVHTWVLQESSNESYKLTKLDKYSKPECAALLLRDIKDHT